ncbi:MAG: hypothetical protein KA369_20395 [Spirochaetes bacterium]|nr:hypothetical protein [Spirochaetota bacterium]
MKKICLILGMMLFHSAIFADQLFLKDGSILKGKIIRITEHDVEYDPEGPRVFDVVDRSSVAQILHDNGKTVSAEMESLKELSRPGGFLDARVRVGGFFTASALRGGVVDHERRLFSLYRPDLYIAYVKSRDYGLGITAMGGGGEIDLLPPALRFERKRDFDFTGIKFGLKARYWFQFSDSAVVNERVYYSSVEGYEQFRGRLMSHHGWGAGPEMNLVFGPRNNSFNFLIHWYALVGQVFGGRIKAAAALRSAHQLQFELAGLYGFPALITAAAPGVIAATRLCNRASFGGYTLRLGLGPHFTMNRNFPITFGLNVFYGYWNITFSRAPLAYLDGRRKAAHHEIGAEISSGIHI